MSELKTDLNVAPYYDDYDEDKQFYRILFNPRRAVQARELTQIQTILQNQVSRFGDHIFKQGSVVDGCSVSYESRFDYVHVVDDFDDSELNTASGVTREMLITNSTNSNNAVRAVSIISKDGFVSNFPETNRFYLRYLSTGKDNLGEDQLRFQSGEKLYIYNNEQSKLGTLDANNLITSIDAVSSNAIGQGYGITVSDGIIYQKGHFLKVDKQTITVKDFDRNVDDYVVGFQSEESIVNSSQDVSLKDQAAGFSNLNAPGADRLKLTPVLQVYSNQEITDLGIDDFFTLVEFGEDEPTQQNNDTIYNRLGDEFARRTYEQAGNYFIKPLQIEAVSARSNTENFFSYQVSPGITYVNGYRVEFVGANRVNTRRGLDTEVSQNQIITANYGKYVDCNEVVGAFELSELAEVLIYDQAQESITDYEGVDSAPSGTLVGRANIKSVIHNTGTKGKPDARYLVYLFNVRMESGRSFSTDAKSFYSSSPRLFKADIILENNRAVIKELSKQSLIFNTGLNGIRRFTDGDGVNDTSYTYRQTSTATLQSNGFVTFTLNTPAPGAQESLPFSPGTLSDSAEREFNIILSANAFSANSSGTLNIVASNTTIIGSGTDFANEYSNNDLIRINVDGSSFSIHRIEEVVNSSVIIIDTAVGTANSAANYQKYFVSGTYFDLDGASNNINVLSNTQFSVSTTLTLDSGTQTVIGQYPVSRNLAVPASKNVRKDRLVKIDCSNNVNTNSGPWNLGFSDIHKIKNIWVGSTYANTNPDRVDWFVLDNGQRDDHYEHGRLIVKPEHAGKISTASRLLVNIDHFEANTSAGVGFFTVDSYPIDDVDTANTTAIQTAEIPRYTSTDGKNFDLRNVVDFRPRKFNTASSVSTTDPANTSISVNPVSSNNSFNTASGGQYLAEVDSRFRADIEYFLPRFDVVTLSADGELSVSEGEPEVEPRVPFSENDVTPIGTVYVPPFPSLTQRESEQFKRPDLGVRIRLEGNKRYTMKMIGQLEKRIERLEYYTVLNALEQKARDLNVPDANGLDRFKNGIFADPFNSHSIGRINDFEYKIAIDADKGEARPFFKKHSVDFVFNANNSSGVVKTGPYITRPYTNELFIQQKFATEFRNATEVEWQWNGSVNLYPDNDYFQDESVAPNINVDLDLAAPWEAFANSPFGQQFGDWRTLAENVRTDTRVNSGVRRGFIGQQGDETTTTTTTTTTQNRIVNEMNVNTITERFDLGSYVSDFSIQPYIRSREVAFVVTSMKPNTRMYFQFDGDPVDEFCAPGTRSGIEEVESGREDRIVERTGNFGDPIFSDENGQVVGKFRIPSGQFRVGDRMFTVSNVDDPIFGADAAVTKASGVYSASNVSVTKQASTLTTRQPRLVFNSSRENRTLTNVDTRTTFVPWPPPPPPPRQQDTGDGDGGPPEAGEFGGPGLSDYGGEPFAQSILVRVPERTTGTFVSQLGLYFRSKDQNLGVTIYVMEMRAGFPDINNVLGTAYLTPDQINAPGDNTQVETVFTFDYPIFLSANKYYAFMIHPDADSPEYSLWFSGIGGFDVESGQQVFKNPYIGTAFQSANQYSWTALPEKDVKFNLYRANFTVGSGTAIFENEDDEYIRVDGFTRSNNNLSIQTGQVVYTVNAAANTVMTSNTDPFGIIQLIDEADGYLELDSSRGGFTTNTEIRIYNVNNESDTGQITANNLVASATIEEILNLPCHGIVPRFSTIKPDRTTLSYGFKGTDSTGLLDGTARKVQNHIETEFTVKERFAYSKSNEDGNKSSIFNVNFSNSSSYVSPVIDMGRKSAIFIENIINNDADDEHTRYGNAVTKYVSKVALLADGQEAEDMKLFLTAYRPVDTDIKVYVKFQNGEDGDPFNDKVWTELDYSNGSEFVFSNPNDTADYIEYEFDLPSSAPVSNAAFRNPSTGVVEYTREDGARFTTFKSYSIKVVLLSTNPVRVPRLNDLRALCLQA